jgi:hypothetical protein
VVEFVLVSTLVVAVVLALVQLSFALLAFQGSTPDDGAAHTRQLLDMTLPSSYADDVTAGYEDVGGVPTVVVRVHAALPLIAWWGPAETLTAQGHAVVEQP